MKFIIVFVLVLGLAMALEVPTAKQLKQLRNRIHGAYRKDEHFAGRSVRLAFHDCIGTVCDGCVDLNEEANKGLGVIIKDLNVIFNNKVNSMKNSAIVSDFMSRADFWAFAAKTNIDYAIKKNNNMCTKKKNKCPLMPASTIEFKLGRTDCGPEANVTNSPKANGFPRVDMTRTETMEFFEKDFGFSEAEVTALIGGAHSLGRARPVNSGYDGPFSSRGNREWYLNNEVFNTLTDNNTVIISQPVINPANNGPQKFQFNLYNQKGRKIGMMLNTEVETAYDIDINGVEGTTCKINDAIITNKKKEQPDSHADGPPCPRAATFDLVNTFAKDPAQFMTAFSTVFTRMINHGNENLTPIAV